MTAWEDMEPCPCGRPELGRHEKYRAQWLCRAGYLEKEIGYALSELERGGGWPAAGKRRLERLIAARLSAQLYCYVYCKGQQDDIRIRRRHG